MSKLHQTLKDREAWSAWTQLSYLTTTADKRPTLLILEIKEPFSALHEQKSSNRGQREGTSGHSK